MFRPTVCSISIALVLLAAFAVSVDAQARSGSIAGTVTLAGKPAKRVQVVVWISSNSIDPKPKFNTGSTDDEGRYVISGLAAGKYAIAPYQPANSLPERTMFDSGNKSVTLNENEAATGIDFNLAAGGVITGRVVGPDGRPLIEQRITLENVDSKQSLGGIFGGDMYRTDDRGIYRLYGLPAGRYYVVAGDANTSNTITIGLNSARSSPRTYYPGVTEKTDAKVVELSEGSTESGIDIPVGLPEKTYSISGRMIDQATGKPVADVPATYGVMSPGTTSIGAYGTNANSDVSGRFKIGSLKPGKYAVFAGGFSMGNGSDKYTSDPVIIDVIDSDVTDVEIKVRAGISLDGIAVIEGSSDPEMLRRITSVRVSAVSMAPPEPGTIRTPGGRSSQIGADGKFHLEGISPGRTGFYIYQIGSEQIFSVKAVEQDGNLMPDGTLDILPGTEHLNVRLILETGNGTIRGQLNVVGGQLPAGMRFSGSLLRAGQPRMNARSFSVDARGRFAIEHVAAGEYEIQISVFPAPGQQGPPLQIPSVRQNVTTSGNGETTVNLTLDLTPRPGGTPQ